MSEEKKSSKKSSENKKSQKELMAEIKKMEAAKRAEAMKKHPEKKKDESVSFDQWWMMRSKEIPRAHRKEIIKADFKGRGLKDKALKSDWDKALESYGVKLK